MIKPYKYLDFNNSVIVIGAMILKILKTNNKIKYEKVLKQIINSNGENGKFVFPQALSFLFLLGKIEYLKETDELELLL